MRKLIPGSQHEKIYKALRRYGKLSTRGLDVKTGCSCVSTKISQIRAKGFKILRSTEKRGNRVIHIYELA